MFTREEATAYSRNISLLVRMIPYKTSIQNEIVEQLTQQELMDIADSIKNETVINKLAKLAATYYKESPNDETLFCLSMTIATIIKEYEWGTDYLSADGICALAQKICVYKNDYSQTYSNTKESEQIAYTHGRMRPCPYCGSDDIRTYADGTAECDSCGKEYRYAY